MYRKKARKTMIQKTKNEKRNWELVLGGQENSLPNFIQKYNTSRKSEGGVVD